MVLVTIVYTSVQIIYSNDSLFYCSSTRRNRTNRSNLGKQDSTTSEEETQKSSYTATVKSRFERRGSSEKNLESGSKSGELTSSMDESEKDSHASDSVSSTQRPKDETDRAAPTSTRTEENPFHLSKNRITTRMNDKSSGDEIKPTGSPVSLTNALDLGLGLLYRK